VENLWALGTTLSDRGTLWHDMEISRLNFSCYEREDETFLFLVPVVDETWVHSCEPDLVAIKWMVSQKITIPMKMLTGTGSAESHVPRGLQLWEYSETSYPSWCNSECCYYKNVWNIICIPHCIMITSPVVGTCCATQHCSLSQFLHCDWFVQEMELVNFWNIHHTCQIGACMTVPFF
jgi:hypothetical protein